jgi:hypothetical protein
MATNADAHINTTATVALGTSHQGAGRRTAGSGAGVSSAADMIPIVPPQTQQHKR